MGKQVKSARGEVIDFDLLKIKEQIAAAPPPLDVQQRRDFVERRLRRRVKKKPEVESAGEVAVEPTLPSPEDGPVAVVEEKEVVAEETPKTKQRARPKRTTKRDTNG